jgi:hypothetical protein
MDRPKLTSPAFHFFCSNRAEVQRAFLAHLARFSRQFRDVSWQDAPGAFSRVYGEGDAEADTLANLFRGAMEQLLDNGEICVERVDGGNRLVKS